MKKALLLFAALLVAGCGEKPSSEGSESAGEKPTPPSEDVKPSADSPEPLISDADVERLLKEAVDYDSLEERDDLVYQDDKPYSGWAKEMHDSGQAFQLVEVKDGKRNGPAPSWHKNGQKRGEGTIKDSEWVSAKWWNDRGEEVETWQEADE